MVEIDVTRAAQIAAELKADADTVAADAAKAARKAKPAVAAVAQATQAAVVALPANVDAAFVEFKAQVGSIQRHVANATNVATLSLDEVDNTLAQMTALAKLIRAKL